ncbi:hypothetical protein NP233_g9043 [Leucocoprinus birnbaumii]|uniref:Uncharacterized protein n=1 Tax=Leucocoprinus birnbaumii TaxID=56174 RepID=A0AAD5YR93_9AGAR|nr:hypothetical protein NP233_g9043 [Leucocoprinus birnbaumii]
MPLDRDRRKFLEALGPLCIQLCSLPGPFSLKNWVMNDVMPVYRQEFASGDAHEAWRVFAWFKNHCQVPRGQNNEPANAGPPPPPPALPPSSQSSNPADAGPLPSSTALPSSSPPTSRTKCLSVRLTTKRRPPPI